MAERIKGIVKQSGVIPVIDNRLVLITSRRSGNWIIPKGYVEKGLTPAESAAKEAYEEAGLIGRVHPEAAGRYRYRKYRKFFMVMVYPLFIDTILDEWEEMHSRKRVLVTPAEAIEMVCEENLRRIIADYFRHSI
ncbi:MAG: NUDIX hydrolase [Chlorobiaceae bacterium]|nr:NUDIX hydrolase [Chlorobiaceae bacterium]